LKNYNKKIKKRIGSFLLKSGPVLFCTPKGKKKGKLGTVPFLPKGKKRNRPQFSLVGLKRPKISRKKAPKMVFFFSKKMAKNVEKNSML